MCKKVKELWHKYLVLTWYEAPWFFPSLLLIFLFTFLEMGPEKLKDWLTSRQSLNINILAALILLFYIELRDKIKNKTADPKTKAFIYSRLKSALMNINLDIIKKFLNLSLSFEQVDVFLDPSTQLEEYTKETNRDRIETLYSDLSEEMVNRWWHHIEEQKKNLDFFLKNVSLIRAKDENIKDIFQIYDAISNIQLELKKTKEIRIRNKGFVFSDVCSISQTLIKTTKSGLYNNHAAHGFLPDIARMTKD